MTVVVRKIPQVAVKKSGSIRLSGPAEDFVSTANGKTSGRDQLTSLLQTYLNSSFVDVFTVIPGPSGRFTDVRFAAHGSPYYEAEKMELVMARNKGQIQNKLGLQILMIHVDECLDEGGCEGGCYNDLVIGSEPVAVMTNRASFVGVGANVTARCGCEATEKEDEDGEGALEASFRGDGYAVYPGFSVCDKTVVSFEVRTIHDDDLNGYDDLNDDDDVMVMILVMMMSPSRREPWRTDSFSTSAQAPSPSPWWPGGLRTSRRSRSATGA